MFDFFYGNETEQYHYYSVPKLLFTDDKFKELSCHAKLLYGFLLDRTALSVENKWFDKEGHTYVYYKQTDAQKNLNIGKNKATAIFTELENIGLIIRQKQGQGKPTKVFVMNFTKFIGKEQNTKNEESKKATSQTPENRESENINRDSRLPKTGSLSSRKQGIKSPKNREHNNPEINKPKRGYIYQSIYQENMVEGESKRESKERMTDRNSDTELYQEKLAEAKLQISYLPLVSQEYDEEYLRLITSLIAEIYVNAITSPETTISINQVNTSIGRVAAQYQKLNSEHIVYVLDNLYATVKTHKIVNLRKYLVSCLYNAPITMDCDTDLQVTHYFYNNRKS